MSFDGKLSVVIVNGVSKFRVKLSELFMHVRKALVSYIGNTSRYTGKWKHSTICRAIIFNPKIH
jgi:hypothetical protein